MQVCGACRFSPCPPDFCSPWCFRSWLACLKCVFSVWSQALVSFRRLSPSGDNVKITVKAVDTTVIFVKEFLSKFQTDLMNFIIQHKVISKDRNLYWHFLQPFKKKKKKKKCHLFYRPLPNAALLPGEWSTLFSIVARDVNSVCSCGHLFSKVLERDNSVEIPRIFLGGLLFLKYFFSI